VRHPWRAYSVCVILLDMSSRLITAARAFRRAEKVYERTRNDLIGEIFAAAESGTPQVDIVKATGFTREHIRRLVDAERKKRQDAAQS
jgi:hypothetical protein